MAQDTLRVDTDTTIKKRKVIEKIHQKYKSSDFIYSEQTDIEKKLNVWQRFKAWLSRAFSKFFDFNPSSESVDSYVIIMRILGVLFILFVLYKIVKHFMNNEGSWLFGRKSDKVNIIATAIEKNIHTADFKQLITEAISKNEYRLAIRYHYLDILKNLSDKQKIEWDSEKTNYDYYNELKEKEIKDQFKYISYIYDYCWYGEFDIDKNEYEKGKEAFDNLKKIIA